MDYQLSFTYVRGYRKTGYAVVVVRRGACERRHRVSLARYRWLVDWLTVASGFSFIFRTRTSFWSTSRFALV